MSAAAGIATLRQIRDHGVTERANGTAAAIEMDQPSHPAPRIALVRLRTLFSDFHVYCGPT